MKILIFAFIQCFCLLVQCEDLYVTVSPPVGDIMGVVSMVVHDTKPHTISSFLGIPFAEPTSGHRRFSKPDKKEHFTETYNATELKDGCPQNTKWWEALELVPVTEDCLNLNVFVPGVASKNDRKAVMIFIYGGAFQLAFQDPYMLVPLTATKDVVTVTINYRHGAYGFLASEKHGLKGNYGLWDQHMAIQWVNENIAAFGGDPDRVTVFGESAGAVSVLHQALFEGNKGLFQRVIAESGAVGSFWGYGKHPDPLFDSLAEKASCDDRPYDEIMECLREKPVGEIEQHFSFEESFLPRQDGDFIKYDPAHLYRDNTPESLNAIAQFAELDFIIGLNSYEGYSESTLLTRLGGADVTGFEEGMTMHNIDQYMKTLFKFMNKTHTEAISNSMLHEFRYPDWSDSYDDVSRRSLFMDLVKDIYYTGPTVQSLNAHVGAEPHGNTYMYHFEHKPSFTYSPDWITNADHAEELLFVLGFPSPYIKFYGVMSADPFSVMPDNEKILSAAMMEYWTQFAKTG